MNRKEKERLQRVFDLLHHYLFVANPEPDPNDVWEIAMLERDREKCRQMRHELLGKDY